MQNYDLINALGELDNETVLSAREKPKAQVPIPIYKRIPAAALIAAVLAVLLSVGAAAYAIAHASTARLMEAGPMTDGQVQVPVDETGQRIIDSSAIDLHLSQTSNGTTITLDSVMGFADPTESLFYLTFTITPPEGFAFPDDMQYWCFWNERKTLIPNDLELPTASATVKNPDGSASVLWMLMPMGEVSGHRLHIKIGGFGTADKAVVASLYAGSRQIELPGQWEFDFALPELPETQEIAFDAAALQAAGLPLTALRLSSFGGIAEFEAQDVSQLDQIQTYFPDELRALCPDIDWENMSEAEFEELCLAGDTNGVLNDAQFAKLWELIGKLPSIYDEIDHPEVVTLEYPDGSEYTVSYGQYGDNLWINYDEKSGTSYCVIVFNNPQPVSQASAIVINGIRIPL